MIKRSRFTHWSCTKFADFIRGSKKPSAIEWGEWKVWHKTAQSKHPFRYWAAEKLLSRLQDIVYFPSDLFYSYRIYIRNRYFDKIQYLDTGLKPGEYADLDYRILHALFNELVKFVEIELAYLSNLDATKKYEWKNGRCKQAAYDYFEWSEKDNNPNFVAGMKKIKELYEWWTIHRPNRVDAYDNLGDIDDILDNSNKNMKSKIEKSRLLDESYEQEDTDMLIKLMKVRKNLWT